MTTLHTIDRPFTARLASAPVVTSITQPSGVLRRRERDFGVGYGSSSGYASDKRYASAAWGQLRFRCG